MGKDELIPGFFPLRKNLKQACPRGGGLFEEKQCNWKIPAILLNVQNENIEIKFILDQLLGGNGVLNWPVLRKKGGGGDSS